MIPRCHFIYRFALPAALAFAVAGCQSLEAPKIAKDATADDAEKRIYLRLYDDKQAASQGITLVAKDETLQKAIRHAYPDTSIETDGGVNMDRRLDVWAQNLTPDAFLDLLGQQTGYVVVRNSQGGVEVRSTDQWSFTLPSSAAGSLMPQAMSIASQHGVQSIVLGDQDEILLLSGEVRPLSKVRRSLEQLSDRIRLERTLQPLATHQ